jgi:hypothetical protein
MTQPTASGRDQFDPAAFTVVEPRTFEDLKVGDIFRAPSRTLTDAHATAFQAVSPAEDSPADQIGGVTNPGHNGSGDARRVQHALKRVVN